MDTHKYTCKYCHEEYIPKRRYSQKYCSNSCRSKAYHRRQIEKGVLHNNNATARSPIVPNKPNPPEKSPDEAPLSKNLPSQGISGAGVGNAVLGTLIADFVEYIVRGEGNQPATKNDLLALLNKLERYQPIANLPPKIFSGMPYFDLHTNNVVYF